MAETTIDPSLGPCAWCGGPSVTEVVTRPGRKRRKTAPVCEKHAADFERRGIATVRSEVEAKLAAELKRSQWRRRQRGWR